MAFLSVVLVDLQSSASHVSCLFFLCAIELNQQIYTEIQQQKVTPYWDNNSREQLWSQKIGEANTEIAGYFSLSFFTLRNVKQLLWAEFGVSPI